MFKQYAQQRARVISHHPVPPKPLKKGQGPSRGGSAGDLEVPVGRKQVQLRTRCSASRTYSIVVREMKRRHFAAIFIL